MSFSGTTIPKVVQEETPNRLFTWKFHIVIFVCECFKSLKILLSQQEGGGRGEYSGCRFLQKDLLQSKSKFSPTFHLFFVRRQINLQSFLHVFCNGVYFTVECIAIKDAMPNM